MERTCTSCGRDPGDGASCRHCGAAVYRYAVSDEDWDLAAGEDGRLATDDVEFEADFDIEIPDAIVPPPSTEDLGFPPTPPPTYTPHTSRADRPPERPAEAVDAPQRSAAARGCGCAVAIAVLIALVGAGILVFFTVSPSTQDAAVTAAPGECVALGESPDGFVEDLGSTACDAPHDAEVFHRFALADGGFPGDAAIADLADAGCLDAFEAYVGIGYYDSEYWIDWLVPTSDGWSSGDREVVCLLVSGDGSPLVGPAFGSGR
jgi:hypothetical protein